MHPIQIREGSQYGAEIDFATAVQYALTGADENGCERITRLSVTAVYAEDTQTGTRKGEPIISEAGTPVFGYDAEVTCRRTKFGENEDATVSISGIQSHSPEAALVRIQCYTLAAQIAAAANGAAAAATWRLVGAPLVLLAGGR